MAPKRLSETEKQEIAERYRQPNESTATLSRAFGVSTSTIGRLLKNSFSDEEYDELVQKKRSIGRGGAARVSVLDSSTARSSNLNADQTIDSQDSQELETRVGSVSPDSVDVASTDTIHTVIPAFGSHRRTPEMRELPTKRRSRTRSRSRSQVNYGSTDSPDLTNLTGSSNHSDPQLGLSLDGSTPNSPPMLRANSEFSNDDLPETHRDLSSRRRRRRSSVDSSSTEEIDRGMGHPIEVTHPPVQPLSAAVRESNDEYESQREFSEPDPTALDSDEAFPRTRQRRTRRIDFASPFEDTASAEPSFAEFSETPSEMLFSEPSDDDDALDDMSDPVEVWTGTLEQASSVSASVLSSSPLSEAILPKTCYLVVDRLSELISRPLQDFEELGEIPPGETQEQTLPIFDNHRVARRFANRSQRVMKIPDSRVLQKTGAHLQAKGITRVLIDGKVYSLS